jgi:hypothetical protein
MGKEVGGEVVRAVNCPTLYTNLTKIKVKSFAACKLYFKLNTKTVVQ